MHSVCQPSAESTAMIPSAASNPLYTLIFSAHAPLGCSPVIWYAKCKKGLSSIFILEAKCFSAPRQFNALALNSALIAPVPENTVCVVCTTSLVLSAARQPSVPVSKEFPSTLPGIKGSFTSVYSCGTVRFWSAFGSKSDTTSAHEEIPMMLFAKFVTCRD